MRVTVQVESHLAGQHSPCEVLHVHLIGLVVANDKKPVILIDCSELFLEPLELRLTILLNDMIVEIALP